MAGKTRENGGHAALKHKHEASGQEDNFMLNFEGRLPPDYTNEQRPGLTRAFSSESLDSFLR